MLSELIRVRQLNEYRMQLAIASNPHSKEPKQLWNLLDAQTKNPLDEKLDKDGFSRLKSALSKSSSIIVK